MRILQAAARVVGNGNAQVLVHKAVPKRGDVLGRGLAGKQHALNLVAHHNVQRIGELVGLGADQRRLCDVHGVVERILVHAAIDLGRVTAQHLEQRAHKGAAAAHGVLEEAALALVDAHGGATFKAGARISRIDAQLVHGVSRLVDDAVDVGDAVVLVDVRRDARVAHGKALAKRVLGKGKRGVVQVQADELHKVEAHGALGGLGHAGVQKVGSGLLAALADGVYERHDRGLDLVAKRVEALGGKAALVLVEPNIVWVALGVHELGLMLKLGDDSVYIGLKARPVIGRLGLVPHGVGLAGEPGPGLGLLGGNDARFALVAAEHADLVEQLWVVDLAAGDSLACQRADKLDRLLAGQELVMFAGKGAHGVGTGGGAVGGGNGRAVKLGNLEQVLAGPQLALELAEFFDGLIDLHAFGRLACCGLGLLVALLFHTISLISRAERHGWAHGQFAQLFALYPARTKRNAAIRPRNVVSCSPMR